MLKKVLSSANITYVKWDMNRQLTDLGSIALSPERQGELFHRYMLAVYEMMDRLTTDFPHILLENCSGGGARFDPGMLYYAPQTWTSDDTDAIERFKNPIRNINGIPNQQYGITRVSYSEPPIISSCTIIDACKCRLLWNIRI